MAKFKFNQKVDLDRADITDAAIGAAAGEAWSSKDIGKLLKIEASSVDANYTAVGVDDDIEGFLVSIEPVTVNEGFKFGSVQRNGRVWVINADAGAVVVGDEVVAAAQTVAIGTAGKSKVKKGTGSMFRWRVIALAVAGAIGDEVLIERV